MLYYKNIFITFCLLFLTCSQADAWQVEDFFKQSKSDQKSQYLVLDETAYKNVVRDSREKIQQLITLLKLYRHQSKEKQIAFIAHQLSDIPYIHTGAMGEGDWQPSSLSYQPGSVHIQQYPIYRLDGFDCQTFVQVAMALLHSNDLMQFDKNILKISYGAAGNSVSDIVHYYNRNNFPDGDFNPVNQQNGYLTDVTSKGVLAPYAATTSATITRQNWFAFQQKNLLATISVLNKKDGPRMVQRFNNVYSSLHFPRFASEKVSISYIPKQLLAIQQPDGHYLPNQTLLDKIPTPSVIEIVHDAKKWTIDGINIREIIGSELNVSHTGILYRETFNRGDIIYHAIQCHLIEQGQKRCDVKPIVCQKNTCNELMLVHATASHPDGYFWYKQANSNHYVCTPDRPAQGVPYTSCNRVERLPLFNYLTNFQYGSYWYMQRPSLLGIHIENL